MKMEQSVPKRRHINFRSQKNYPEENIQHSEHGESLKSIIQILFTLKWNFVVGSWKSTGRPGLSGCLFLPEPSVHASHGLQFQRRGSRAATTQNRQAQVKANMIFVWSPTWCTNSYLFTHNTFIKTLYMFGALPCSSSGGLRRNCIYGLVHRLRKNS